jgi:hypothetical protein
MRREPETPEQQAEREAREARYRIERISAEEKEIDAAVRRSIKLHGP